MGSAPPAAGCCRFAPTTSGPAHPGTLLAALLCWLDARSRGARLRLRFEDADPLRCTPQKLADMRRALAWLGLDWDAEQAQSANAEAHAAALDRLAADGRLYACTCSRSEIRRTGRPAPDGSTRYPGTCRSRPPPAGDWREWDAAVRLRVEPGRFRVRDEGGADLSQDVAEAMGDPVLRRRDGAWSYHLAVVVDDAADAVTRIVRGRDLAPCTATHVALQQALGAPTPTYRHHLLLLEAHGPKLAKLHGSVGWEELAARYDARSLCGVLAALAGLLDRPEALAPRELLPGFAWHRVRAEDLVVRWTGRALERVA